MCVRTLSGGLTRDIMKTGASSGAASTAKAREARETHVD